VGPVAEREDDHSGGSVIRVACNEGKQRDVRDPCAWWDVVGVDRILPQVRDSQRRGDWAEVACTAQMAKAEGLVGRTTAGVHSGEDRHSNEHISVPCPKAQRGHWFKAQLSSDAPCARALVKGG